MLGGTDDHIWFQHLYEDFFPKVFAFARKHIGDADAAEDLTHDVFLKLWQNRATFSPLIPPDAQLLTIARQLLINRYKREALRQRVYADWQQKTPNSTSADDTERPMQVSELTEKLQVALAGLPPKRREIFEKSRFDNLSYDQISEQLGISRATVESQMVKALRTLRDKLTMVLLFFLF
ncbi:MAG: RNA polymerase sigma-70 factor [Bacteroidetes bacterium]|nr:RNA polymerase sigma-70 factor [Fibrella sp.]